MIHAFHPSSPLFPPAAAPFSPRSLPSPHPTSLCAASAPRRSFLRRAAALSCGLALGFASRVRRGDAARPEGVDRPELLPSGEVTPVIDLERWLPAAVERSLCREIQALDRRTGVKVRVLTQRYPQTPGKAVVPYWGVDERTIVVVADYFGASGGLLKINVGEKVYEQLPPRFWSLLAAKYGNKFFVENNGEDRAIVQSFQAIRDCLDKGGCSVPP